MSRRPTIVSLVLSVLEGSGALTCRRTSDPNSPQVPGTNVVVAGMMGLAFLLTMLIVIWRFRSSAHPVATT